MADDNTPDRNPHLSPGNEEDDRDDLTIRPRPGIDRRNHSLTLRRALLFYAILVVFFWVVTIIVAVGGRGLRGLPPVASPNMTDQETTLIVFTLIASPIMMFVIAFPIYSFFAWRSKGQPRRPAPYLTATRGQIIGWIAITVFHAMLLYAWGLIFLRRIDRPPAPNKNTLIVDVLGEQWNWNFTYPQYNNAQSEVLELPVDRPVTFIITSADVTHSFEVPNFGRERDAVPGVLTNFEAIPTAMGSYTIRCYELCGMFHTYMEQPMYIVSSDKFTSWVHSLPVQNSWAWPINGAGIPNSIEKRQPPPGINPKPSTVNPTLAVPN